MGTDSPTLSVVGFACVRADCLLVFQRHGYCTLGEAFTRLDFSSAVQDVRRFSYVVRVSISFPGRHSMPWPLQKAALPRGAEISQEWAQEKTARCRSAPALRTRVGPGQPLRFLGFSTPRVRSHTVPGRCQGSSRFPAGLPDCPCVSHLMCHGGAWKGDFRQREFT